MACNRKAVNELVTCPYDAAHRVLKSRLQMHIAKCKLNHLDKEMAVCPFNATHQMERGLLEQHLARCPDRLPVDLWCSTNIDKNNIFKGRTAVPSYHHPLPPSEESWDECTSSSSGYLPPAVPPKDGIILDLGMMKPAERKNYYKTFHLISENNEEESKPMQEPLRKPRQKHEEIMSDQKLLPSTPNLGLGRGIIAKGDNRIAADIFSKEKETPSPRQPESYKNIVSGMNSLNLGLGRGRPLSSTSPSQGAPSFSVGRGIPLTMAEKLFPAERNR